MRGSLAGDHPRLATMLAVLIGASLAATGCGVNDAGEKATPRAAGSLPSVEEVPCPHDVAKSIRYLDGGRATEATCWYLTVLEDRTKPDGRTIRLFFVRVPPPDGEPAPDPMFSAYGGFDLARTNGYNGGGIAERLHREVIVMDVRGIGLSEPNLACPEVQDLALPISDGPLMTNMGDHFTVAVQACRNRLTARGIDVASYNLAEMAADAEDLRVALGIDQWNLGMVYGTASAVGFEVLRRFPEHIRAAVFDSPAAPQVDLFTQAVVGTEYSVSELAKACKAQPACDKAFPHVRRAWRQALERLHEEPTRIGARLGYGVIIDDVAAVRVMRGLISWFELGFTGPENIYLLRDTGFARRERPKAYDVPPTVGLDRAPEPWLSDPVLSHGYTVNHWDAWRLSLGTFYSILCHDELPFVDRAARSAAIDGDSWYVKAYGPKNPYLDACGRWNVGHAESDPHEPVVSDVPILMLHPHFDPYSPLPLIEETASTLSRSVLVDLPLGHNVLWHECPISIRNAFIDDPTSPADTSCVADMPKIKFARD
jgi:pimeloyl-ACP methyl ester carboxylesterase